MCLTDNLYPIPENAKWSKEAIIRNRIKRMARRLYKKSPLFACQEISERFNIPYTTDNLFNDLKQKNGRISPLYKSGKQKYNGKRMYLESIRKDISRLINDGNVNAAAALSRRFYKLQESIRKPWKCTLRYQGIEYYFNLPNHINHEIIRDFLTFAQSALNSGQGIEPVNKRHQDLIDQFQKGG